VKRQFDVGVPGVNEPISDTNPAASDCRQFRVRISSASGNFCEGRGLSADPETAADRSSLGSCPVCRRRVGRPVDRGACLSVRCASRVAPPTRSAASVNCPPALPPLRSARLALALASSRDVEGQRRVTSADVASTTRMTRDQYVITPTTSVL